MKKIVLSFVLFVLTAPLFAGGSIKGIIVDATDRSNLEYVNITLLKDSILKPVVMGVTDSKGAFMFPTTEDGNYTLKINFVGFTSVNKSITIAGNTVNLGTIYLKENSKKLGEVEVVGQGSQMHFDIDKRVFSVDKNIAADGGSASDVLKNIPSVTVDNQGNVSLRKDGNVEVWINGKASGLTADNRAQVLQQMPAESIESIEIMTNPSAKYSPEGSAGIINIVMKQNRKAGYYGSISAGAIYPDGGKLGKNVGASINYSSSKFDAYVNLGYRNMSSVGGGKTDRYNYIGTDTTLLSQNNSTNSSFSGLFIRGGFDYKPDNKNTYSISGFGMAGDNNQSTFTHNVLANNLLSNAIVLRNYTQDNSGSGTRPSLNLNFDYRHDFDKKGTFLTGTASYSNHNRTGSQTYVQTDLVNMIPNSNITQLTDGKNTEWDFKLDYTNKLTETSKLEAGWESTLSNLLSTTSGINNLTNSTFIPSYFNTFNYNEQIHAAYLTFGNKINQFTYQLGLRGEILTKESTNITKVGITSIDTTQVISPKSFFHIFPSFYLSYALPNDEEIQFNYSNRVNRPRGNQINPYKNFSDSTNISYGNPDLLPQYSASLELNYIKTWGAQTLSTSLYYRSTDNVIEAVHFLHNGVMESTYLNIAKAQNTGLELISKNRLFNFLSLTSTLNLYYSTLDSATYVNPYNTLIKTSIPGQNNFSWSANIMANVMLSKTFSGQITAEYESPELIAQGTRNAQFAIDLGLRKTFFDRKLSVSLNVRDLLNSNKNNQTISGSGFYQNSSTYYHGRMFGLTVSYNFGNMKPKPTDMKKEGQNQDMNIDSAE